MERGKGKGMRPGRGAGEGRPDISMPGHAGPGLGLREGHFPDPFRFSGIQDSWG